VKHEKEQPEKEPILSIRENPTSQSASDREQSKKPNVVVLKLTGEPAPISQFLTFLDRFFPVNVRSQMHVNHKDRLIHCFVTLYIGGENHAGEKRIR
jgi:hypothetical protein